MATKSNVSVPKNTDAYGISVVGVNQRISNTDSSSVLRTKEVAGKLSSLYQSMEKEETRTQRCSARSRQKAI
jgi:hypothetical protein